MGIAQIAFDKRNENKRYASNHKTSWQAFWPFSDPPKNLTTKKLLIYSGERLYSPPQTGNSHIHGPFLKKGLPLGNFEIGLNFFYFAAEGKNFGAQENRHRGQIIQTSEGAWGSAGLYCPEVMDIPAA